MNNVSFQKPMASVIMPVYNTEKYIDQAIESVLNQTFKDFELLLLNDGSSDNSLARLEHYARLDKRCRVFSSENQGIVATRNKGVQFARGDILINMDSDDICAPNRFQVQVDYLNNHPNCVAVGSKVLLIDSDGMPIMHACDLLNHIEIDSANMSGNGLFMCNPSVAMRKSKVNEVGGYVSKYEHAEDLDLFLKMAEIGEVANINQTLLHYRQHAESVGYAKRASQIMAITACVIESHQRRKLELPEKLRVIQNELEPYTPKLFDIHSKWAWWAIGAGNVATARKHAFKAFLLQPFNIKNLRLYAVVLRGY